ncbi:hypothetical protein ACH495_03870 [Micromonospora sp. NPDC018662]|uniref:hypothetical protein n=1 Tax=Micromonospora sp. NPDC018662 TaxID=3364238 RepID=UPI0037B23A4A
MDGPHVDRADLNRYADPNRLIVLHPWANATGVDPNGCRDRWGYLGAANFPITEVPRSRPSWTWSAGWTLTGG